MPKPDLSTNRPSKSKKPATRKAAGKKRDAKPDLAVSRPSKKPKSKEAKEAVAASNGKTRPLHVLLPREMHKRLKVRAAEAEMNLRDYVKQILTEYGI